MMFLTTPPDATGTYPFLIDWAAMKSMEDYCKQKKGFVYKI